MKVILPLLILFFGGYFALRAMGPSGRSSLWQAISPHLFPIVMILTIIFGLLGLHFNGVSLRLF